MKPLLLLFLAGKALAALTDIPVDEIWRSTCTTNPPHCSEPWRPQKPKPAVKEWWAITKKNCGDWEKPTECLERDAWARKHGTWGTVCGSMVMYCDTLYAGTDEAGNVVAWRVETSSSAKENANGTNKH